ncbi:MarR family winged helix-turn-helix transcriptional regulator [Rhizobium halophytocola]|uniref:MarR family transcriptional regulator for hemolysin n=1 Tax=Rhizobium halophytocola TaxID=735519 RepID=A0ABS4DWF4_9HYPH|nr:MarR family transcriptional regulator [Rhizobium halophytocola]MBP1850002.1 MarR family transcriptional regulator for hemolysin [Rhizobium halophytocola]
MSQHQFERAVDIARLLSQTARLWRRAADRRLQPYGLGESAWRALLMISNADKPPRQKDLADFLSLDGSSVARLVDGLEKSGHVRRTEGTQDRRAKQLALTEQGAELVASVQEVVFTLSAEAVATLAASEVAAVEAGLSALRGFFEAEISGQDAV